MLSAPKHLSLANNDNRNLNLVPYSKRTPQPHHFYTEFERRLKWKEGQNGFAELILVYILLGMMPIY